MLMLKDFLTPKTQEEIDRDIKEYLKELSSTLGIKLKILELLFREGFLYFRRYHYDSSKNYIFDHKTNLYSITYVKNKYAKICKY